jgi:Gpi18-like mannosyltransferase
VNDLTRDNTTTVPWHFIVFNFLFSRLWILVVAGLSLLALNHGKFFSNPHSILDWFNQWDAGWYLDIVRHGYNYLPGKESNIAFFPMYPILVRVLTCGGNIDDRLVGYLISHAALFVATVMLWKLAVLEIGDERSANHSVQFLLLTPVGVFFSSIYTESIFLAWLVSTLYFARTQRWLLAGLCAYAAALTRVVGLLLVIPLVCEYVLQRREKLSLRSPSIWRALVCCALPGLAFLTYVTYLGWTFGEPLAFLKADVVWGRKLAWPWAAFFHLNREPFYRIWFVCFAIMAAGLLILGFWWRLRPTYLVLLCVFTLISLSSNRLESLPRYLSVLFPYYFVLALLTKKWPNLTTPLFVVAGGLQVLSVILFVNGYWFT